MAVKNKNSYTVSNKIIASTQSNAFSCDQCGLCCKNLDKSTSLDFLNRGDGVCVHFNESESLCNIYEDRPLLCRVEDGYTLFKSQISKQKYYDLNMQSCTALKAQQMIFKEK